MTQLRRMTREQLSPSGHLSWLRAARVIFHWPAQNHAMNSLDGIRVLDLSRVLAGPWCTQTLADLGADVIKIERPGMGDDTRGWGPPFLPSTDEASAQAAYYLGANRNKRSVTCDIAQPEGQALIRALAAHCDVFVENFKVGDMARYGLDYASLAAIKPGLVYCSITGFGQTGPYAERAGYDYAVQGMGGLMSVTGERDGTMDGNENPQSASPQKVGVAVADLFTGLYATTGILAALRHAGKTGQGQHIDMALLDTQVAMLANLGANYLISGQVPGRMGNAHQNIVPYQVFEVAPAADGTPDHIIVAVGNDSQYYKFCSCLSSIHLGENPIYLTNADRVRNRSTLVPQIAAILKTNTKAHWLAALEAAKVPCGAINNLAEVFADPQVVARGMVDHWAHPHRAALPLVASPLKLSATPVRGPDKGLPPPLLGQHTDVVLHELLSIPAEKLAELKKKNIV